MRRNIYYIAHDAKNTIYLKTIVPMNSLDYVALGRNPKMSLFMEAMVTRQDAQPHLV